MKTNKSPLKYRVISEKHTQGQAGLAGERTFVLCLNNGLHATVALNEFLEFKSLNELPTNMADSVKFAHCDCSRHPEPAPSWLSEITQAYMDNPRKAVKPKKRPTMGR